MNQRNKCLCAACLAALLAHGAIAHVAHHEHDVPWLPEIPETQHRVDVPTPFAFEVRSMAGITPSTIWPTSGRA